MDCETQGYPDDLAYRLSLTESAALPMEGAIAAQVQEQVHRNSDGGEQMHTEHDPAEDGYPIDVLLGPLALRVPGHDGRTLPPP